MTGILLLLLLLQVGIFRQSDEPQHVVHNRISRRSAFYTSFVLITRRLAATAAI